ncbi:MAG TPA: NAD(P)-dependent oxidoreductase [Acidobacteriaceae bacterium]|nr:NAD(P)-dependent oxidoreductase [Acidobacteriaceae bacterium]
MHVVVIGGTGHIGSYLTPMLADAGHSVTCVCRGTKAPYCEHPAWRSISYLGIDRTAEEEAGVFGRKIAELGADAVIDLTCYHLKSAEQLAVALRGRTGHLLHCGTIWVHGSSVSVPTMEDAPRRPFGDYGIRKAAIEAWLLQQAEEAELPVTILHPGHLVGPGWQPISPAGNFNPAAFAALRRGEELRLPNFGMETVHHVHAADVARAFVLALHHRDAALGESFHVVSGAALTLRGYAEQIADWFSQPAELRFLPWEEWKQGVSTRDAALTEDHLRHSPNCSIEKARALLGYEPRYASIEAVRESVSWLIDNGIIP